MTFNEALLIQRSQMVYYRNLIGRKGVKTIKANTIYPKDINPNELMNVSEINLLVPRGGSFEYLIEYKGQKSCPLAFEWSKAVRRGLV